MMDDRKLTVQDFLSLQDELNESTVPNWKSILTKDHFMVAMVDEFSELINSMPWKWWKKNGDLDEWNIKIETIDILHFYFSILAFNRDDGYDFYLGYPDNFTPVNRLVSNGVVNYHSIMKNLKNLINMDNPYYIDEFVRDVGFTQEELSAIYVAKHTLNGIRQTGGYKEGHYKKTQNGHEDNQYLEALVLDFLEEENMTLYNLQDNVKEVFL